LENNKIAFVSGAYRADNHNEIYENIQRARRVAYRLWEKGIIAICPHNNSAFFSSDFDEQIFLDGYLHILTKCDLVVIVAEGADSSEGTQNEITKAKELNIPVYFDYEINDIKL